MIKGAGVVTMKLLKKTPVAVIIMLAAVLLSFFFGSVYSLSRERGAIMDGFESGTDEIVSIQYELDYIAQNARNLVSIAGNYPDMADSDALGQTDTALNELTSAKSVSAKAAALDKLVSAAEILLASLNPADMKPVDRDYHSTIGSDVKASLSRISSSSYNDAVAEFNERLDSFPVNLTAGLFGVTALEPFEITE